MSHKVKMKHFENPFEDYTPERYEKLVTNNEINKQSRLYCELENKWQETLRRFKEFNDYSIYTGTSGVALLKFKKAPDDPKNLQEIKQLLCLARLKRRRHTFLCGDTGPLAIGAVVCAKLNETAESKTLISKLESMKDAAVDPKSDLPSEYLYGRAGYIYSLLFVNKHIKPSPFDDKLIRQVKKNYTMTMCVFSLLLKVIEAIFTIGKSGAARGKFKCPLMYQWHDSYYLGAAHGLSGILYLLLHLKELLTEQELKNLVKPTIDYLATLQ